MIIKSYLATALAIVESVPSVGVTTSPLKLYVATSKMFLTATSKLEYELA